MKPAKCHRPGPTMNPFNSYQIRSKKQQLLVRQLIWNDSLFIQGYKCYESCTTKRSDLLILFAPLSPFLLGNHLPSTVTECGVINSGGKGKEAAFSGLIGSSSHLTDPPISSLWLISSPLPRVWPWNFSYLAINT